MARHLLQLEGIDRDTLAHYFSLADTYFAAAQGRETHDHLAGRTVANLFFENSTRTANSFYLAGRRLGAAVLDFTGAGSSLSKGETLVDTAHTILAMGIDAFVVRHVAAGAPHMIAEEVGVPVINAGDGFHEHPTQGLLDVYTLCREFGSLDALAGLTVGIVGDLLHSRVARSDVHALKACGVRVVFCGPPPLCPAEFASLGCEVTHDLDALLPEADVLMFLRIQRERMDEGLISSLKEYKSLYGMTARRLKACRPEIKIMHPGPMNRDIEIEPEVADGPHSLIRKQVTCGLAVRMAILATLVGESDG